MKQPKTQGTEFFFHSLTAFNGSGYADRTDADSFFDSYIAYKHWKNQPQYARYMDSNRNLHRDTVNKLLEGPGPGRTPHPGNISAFSRFYPPAANW